MAILTPFAVCEAIASRNGSPLFLVSRLLGVRKRRLFLAAYAAMRIVDDLVDENFLAAEDAVRVGDRERTLVRIENWRLQAVAAARGEFVALEEAFEPMVFMALTQTVGCSDLGEWPWNALAEAMSRDVREREIVSWDDFLSYCEGATVSPAATFAYILSVEVRADRYVSGYGIEACREQVRQMAIFCYLVHIMRDLAKDVRKQAQLITIPGSMLAQVGFRRETLVEGLRDVTLLVPLMRLLLERAGGLLDEGWEAIHRIPLRPLERMILSRLLQKYIDLYRQLLRDPTCFLA